MKHSITQLFTAFIEIFANLLEDILNLAEEQGW
jgi:hypothetical protein